jgi:hypothetical protein
MVDFLDTCITLASSKLVSAINEHQEHWGKEKIAKNAFKKCELQTGVSLSTLVNLKRYKLFLPQYLRSNRMEKITKCGGSQCTLYVTLLQWLNQGGWDEWDILQT